MIRLNERALDSNRPVNIETGYLLHPDGSVLISMGKTKVICTAMIEERVPPFLKGAEQGWVTAEYSMLPGSTNTRKQRPKAGKVDGRSTEIQRLIGRSLRTVVDMKKLGERTIWVDCDVIQADGGTRTASITGAYVAMALAIEKLIEEKVITESPLIEPVAAISVGVVEGQAMLDLNYIEDSNADVDMNVIMTKSGKFIEVQGTGEQTPFSKETLMELLELGEKGVRELIELQEKVIRGV